MANPIPMPALPEFFYEEEWVDLCEKIIATNANGANNNQKFLSIYKALPRDIARENTDLLKSNAATTYTDLIANLRTRFTLPAHEKFDILYRREEIGDRSPKEFMLYLKNKYKRAGHNVTAGDLRQAYASGISAEFQQVFLTFKETELDDAVSALEEIWFAQKTRSHAQSSSGTWKINGPLTNENSTAKVRFATSDINKFELENLRMRNELEETKEQLEKLKLELKNISRHSASSSSNDKSSRDASRERPRYTNSYNNYKKTNSCPPLPNEDNNYGLCFYHSSFGNQSHNCQSPCNWRNFQIPRHNCNNPRYCKWNKFVHNSKN